MIHSDLLEENLDTKWNLKSRFTTCASTSVGWLDDIGLPQYKDQFHEARVDGRMIQYLTVVRLDGRDLFALQLNRSFVPRHVCSLPAPQNDLLTLKVTSQLHHLSIKCAIHVLHANKFNPNCLRRRPGDEVGPI